MSHFKVFQELGRLYRPSFLLVGVVLALVALIAEFAQGSSATSAVLVAIAMLLSVAFTFVFAGVMWSLFRGTDQGAALWPAALAMAAPSAVGVAISMLAASDRLPTGVELPPPWTIFVFGTPLWFLFFWAGFVAARRCFRTRA